MATGLRRSNAAARTSRRAAWDFYLPEELDTADVLIELPNAIHEGVIIPATLVRAKRCADGWYDVGALFRLPAIRKSTHEMCLKV